MGGFNTIRLGRKYQQRSCSREHSSDYWNPHMQQALAQHCDVLGIAPVAPGEHYRASRVLTLQ